MFRYITERFTHPCKVFFFQICSCCVLKVPRPIPWVTTSIHGQRYSSIKNILETPHWTDLINWYKRCVIKVEFEWNRNGKHDLCDNSFIFFQFPSGMDNFFFQKARSDISLNSLPTPVRFFWKHVFAVCCRDLFPKCYGNNSPHTLAVRMLCSIAIFYADQVA